MAALAPAIIDFSAFFPAGFLILQAPVTSLRAEARSPWSGSLALGL